MARYAFHDLTLEVEGVEAESGVELGSDPRRALVGENERLGRRPDSFPLGPPGEGRVSPPLDRRARCFGQTAFVVWRTETSFYLTDGASLLRLEPRKGRGEARLAPSFFLQAASSCDRTSGSSPCSSSCGRSGSTASTPRDSSPRTGRESSSSGSPAAASPRSPSRSSAAAGAISPTTPCCCAPDRTASRRSRSGATSTSSARRRTTTRTCRSARRRPDQRRRHADDGSASKRPTRSSASAPARRGSSSSPA